MHALNFYFISILLAGIVTACSVPLLHRTIGPYMMDRPSGFKRHERPVMAVGGCAVMLGLCASLIFIRLVTQFPTGTLHSLRGILWGGAIIFITGLLDDMHKPKGLSVPVKLLAQFLAVCCLLYYGVQINLFEFPRLSLLLTFLWVIGITNAFNLLDISDGLCVSQAAVCALGVYLIALPSERIYVNFGACALLGACLGFWPYNHWPRWKTFLGDSGSTLLGFLLAALTMGADYSHYSHVGVLAPLLILAIPIFDTTFVTLMRLLNKKNPLRASNDHAALRLIKIGFSPTDLLYWFSLAAVLCNALAFIASQAPANVVILLCVEIALLLGVAAWYLSRIRMDS